MVAAVEKPDTTTGSGDKPCPCCGQPIRSQMDGFCEDCSLDRETKWRRGKKLAWRNRPSRGSRQRGSKALGVSLGTRERAAPVEMT